MFLSNLVFDFTLAEGTCRIHLMLIEFVPINLQRIGDRQHPGLYVRLSDLTGIVRC